MDSESRTVAVPEETLGWSLLLLRLGVFIVFLMWTLDKFVQPEHAAAVYENFYFIGGLGAAVFYLIGSVQMLIILAFVTGLFKKWTYGAILVFHAISTLSSWSQYLDAFNNLLFFAAWPMLAACVVLFLLRDYDNRWTLKLGG
jgi:putative oxidoreductase